LRAENKARLVGVVLLLVFIFYEYPSLLGNTLYSIAAHIWFFISIIIPLIVAAVLASLHRLGSYWRIIAALFLILLAVGLFSEATRSLEIGESLRVGELGSLPPIDPVSVRVVPLAVAYTRAEASFSSSTYKPSRMVFLVYRDGKPYWQIPIVPEKSWNYMTKHMKGFIEIPAYSFNITPRLVEKEFKYGFGHFHDLVWAAYIKAGIWGSKPELADSYIVEARDGSYWIVVPLTSWRLEKLFYSVPRVTGVLLVCSNGTIHRLSVKEALSNPLTRGGPLIPEWMARWYVEKLNYRHGLLNTFTVHRDMFKLRDPSRTNKQPWLIRDSSGRLWWLFAAEPYGKGGGVSRIIMVDARDPSIKVYEYSVSGGLLIGPVKASDLAKASLPRYDWERYSVEEPIPIMLNGTLYWRVAVIPKDASMLDSLVLVNSRSGSVLHVKSDAELEGFLAQGSSPKAPLSIQDLIKKLKQMIAEEQEKLNEMSKILKEIEGMMENKTSTSSTK